MPVMQANGVELSYHIQGEGEPLLLHMGIGQQWVLWPPDLMNRLEAAGFQVIAYDYRDTGQSSVMDHLGPPKALSVLMGALMGRPIAAPYTLWDLADDAAGLLDGLGITSAHTMGISMGGMVAQCLTIRHPDRVRSLCSIMSTTGSRRYAVGQPHALRALLRPVPQEEEAAVEHVVRVYQVLGGSHYHQDMDWLRSRFRLSAQRGYTPHGFLRHFAAILSSGSRRHLLADLDLPAVVMHGTADPLIPVAAGRATARAIPGARFVEFPNMGHVLPPELYAQMVSDIAQNAKVSRSTLQQRSVQP